eukprot:749453-Hanusia_phi.AAC.2
MMLYRSELWPPVTHCHDHGTVEVDSGAVTPGPGSGDSGMQYGTLSDSGVTDDRTLKARRDTARAGDRLNFGSGHRGCC